MSRTVAKAAEKTSMSRRFGVAAVVAAFSLSFAASSQADDLNEDVVRRVEQMTSRTVLYRNDSDRIPQLEYLRPDGTGVVWSAALRDKVVPVVWTIGNGEDGKGSLCLSFKGADIGTSQDLKMCDGFDLIEAGIRDVRDGDPYGLLKATRMKADLPQDLNSLADVDRLLGQD